VLYRTDTAELKKALVKLRKIFKSTDPEVIDQGVKLAASLGEPAIFETLLEGCCINENGELCGKRTFSRSKKSEKGREMRPLLARALIGLIAAIPKGCDVDPSLTKVCKNLDLSDSLLTELPPGLEHFTSLEALSLVVCRSLQNVDVLKNLTRLTELYLGCCESLQNVDVLKNLTRLTELDLGGCESLQNVDGLKNCTQLTELYLGGCTVSVRYSTVRRANRRLASKIRFFPKVFKDEGGEVPRPLRRQFHRRISRVQPLLGQKLLKLARLPAIGKFIENIPQICIRI
jgi:hypothetical protein